MPGGYKGKLLHIDLSAEASEAIEPPEEILTRYIGGRGLGAKLYWDLLPPDADPLGPENIFMVLSGPVSGTMTTSSGEGWRYGWGRRNTGRGKPSKRCGTTGWLRSV